MRDVVLPSIVVDVTGDDELNVVASMPIVICNDSIDTNFIRDVLEVPKGDWAGFSDLTFGLGIAAEGHIEGNKSPAKQMEDEMMPIGEGSDRVITATPELEATASLSDISISRSMFNFITRELGNVPVKTSSELVSVETECATVSTVIVCDDSLRVDDVVIRARPEAAVDPARPIITPIAIPVLRAKLVPACQGSSAMIFLANLTSHDDVDYDKGDFVASSLSMSGVGRGASDPRLGFFIAHFIRSQPGFHLRAPIELPIPAFARHLGGRFAVEPNLGSVHRRKPRQRSRWMQTHVKEASETSNVGIQVEYRSRIDNFGLPPRLCLSAIIRMTRQRGTSIGRLVFLLEREYSQIMQRGFTETERSNVWGLVSLAASLHCDEDQEIWEWGSSFEDVARQGSINVAAHNKVVEMLRASHSWAIEDDILYEMRSPRLAWENSPSSATTDNEGEQPMQQGEPTASAATSALPHNETQNEDEGPDVLYFPADYKGPLDPDFDPFM